VLILPFTLIEAWLNYAGMTGIATWLMFLLTPPIAVAMLMFRGHLFASLHGTSRRQRLYRERFADPT